MRAPFWSGRTLRRLALAVCSVVAVGYVSTLFAAEATLSKAEKEERVAAAEALLEEALAAEVDGRGEDRAALLAKAEALAPDLPAIQWQRGRVLVDGKWMPAEDIAVSSADRVEIERYVAKRSAAQDAAVDQLELANWCEEKRLYEQERAHLTRVLTLEPDNSRARARLGYVRVDDEWISRGEIAYALAEQERLQTSLARYGGEFERLARTFADGREDARNQAIDTIRAIRDVDAIPALERIIADRSAEAAMLALDALSNMPEKEASLSIARFASLSRSLRVRNKATEALRGRQFDHFVPEMLATMRSSVESRYSLDRRQDARLVYRQVFYREARRSADAIVNDVVYANSQPSLVTTRFGTGDPAINGGKRDDLAVAQAAAADSARWTRYAESQVTKENWDVRDFNAHMSETLTAVTGESLGPYAQAWWNWWDRYNELAQSGPKQVAVVQYGQSTASVGYEQYPNRQRITDIRQPQKFQSCFAAGTLVPTNRGEVAIEQVRVGDLVLAQDIETGEIAFKPVLETTVRPPAEILRIEYEGGSLRSTGGHPFWVSGEGWVHARRLQSGMELHTTNGTVRVSQVISDGEEPAYNLIVADFANYFVGEARILSHDNSSRTPTDAIVPGLAQR